MLSIDSSSFIQIKMCRVCLNITDIKLLYEFIHGEDIAVCSNGPSKQSKIVQKAFADEAVVPVEEKVGFGVTL